MSITKLPEQFKTQDVTCDKCEGPLFTLNWVFKEAPDLSGLYRTCAGCGTTKPVVEGCMSTGSVE